MIFFDPVMPTVKQETRVNNQPILVPLLTESSEYPNKVASDAEGN